MAEPATQAEDDSAKRVGYISHAIHKEKLKSGDHIYCKRGFYNHHGIYIGERNCEVIHFSGDEKGLLRKKIGRQSNETMKKVTELSADRDDKLSEDSTAKAAETQPLIDGTHKDHIRIFCVKSTTLDSFGAVYLVAYGSSKFKKSVSIVADATHTVKAMPPSETVKLAKHFLGHPEEWGNYNLTSNNCETFTCFCKTGLLNIAAQLHHIDRNFVSETLIKSSNTAEEALAKYREKIRPRSKSL